uniref:Uncharacterized protein n=1 Tax=Glossina pallidipes TaxID=7398 RepID=A0A1A9ZC64_GLOPL
MIPLFVDYPAPTELSDDISRKTLKQRKDNIITFLNREGSDGGDDFLGRSRIYASACYIILLIIRGMTSTTKHVGVVIVIVDFDYDTGTVATLLLLMMTLMMLITMQSDVAISSDSKETARSLASDSRMHTGLSYYCPCLTLLFLLLFIILLVSSLINIEI